MKLDLKKCENLKKWKGEGGISTSLEAEERLKELLEEIHRSRVVNTHSATREFCKFMGIEPDPDTGKYPLVIFSAPDEELLLEREFLEYILFREAERRFRVGADSHYTEWNEYQETKKEEASAQTEVQSD